MLAAKPEAILFSVVLTKSRDWDKLRGGWRCAALTIPGSNIANIYATGDCVTPNYYNLEGDLIRWVDEALPPSQLSVVIMLSEALNLEEETLRWKNEFQEAENEMRKLKVENLQWQRWASIAAIVAAIATVAGVAIAYVFQNKKDSELARLEMQKIEMQEQLLDRLRFREEMLEHALTETYLLMQELGNFERVMFYRGVILDKSDRGISDVSIRVEGNVDNQVLSYPGGHFFVRGKPGDRLILQKDGYKKESRQLVLRDFYGAAEILLEYAKEK